MTQFETEIRNRNIQRSKNITSNFSKGESDLLTKDEFDEFQKSNEVYTPGAVSAFVADLKKGLEANEITQEGYDAAMSDLKKLKPVKVFDNDMPAKVFFAKSNIEEKSEAAEEPEVEIEKGIDDESEDNNVDFEKGIYKDNAENRKKGRAGQKYGGKKEGEKGEGKKGGFMLDNGEPGGKKHYDKLDDKLIAGWLDGYVNGITKKMAKDYLQSNPKTKFKDELNDFISGKTDDED